MEEIFKIYDETTDPNFIGQDLAAQTILENSSKNI
jgi:hypothetical protein